MSYHKFMHLICYKKVYSSEKEAQKDLKKVKDLASNPKVIQGKVEGCWLVQLYETEHKMRLEEGMLHFRNKGLEVFRYER